MDPLLMLLAFLAPAQCPPVSALPEENARGFSTDRPSYAPGDTIQVHGNWDPAQWESVEYKLKRIDRSSNAFEVPVSIPSIQSSGPVAPVSRGISYGSFVNFPVSPKPGGRLRFTIEGWFLPTWVPGLPPPPLSAETPPSISDDVIALAGQIGLAPGITDPDAQPLEQTIAGPGGIGIDATGTLFGAVTLGGSLHVLHDDAPLAADGTLDSDDWHYVGLTYDGAAGILRLYVDGQVVASQSGLSGSVDEAATTLRLGARAEAPGDLTGQFDGRLDDWSLWDRALDPVQLYAVMHGTPFPGIIGQPAPKRLLELKFEEDYADFNPSAGIYRVLDSAGPSLTHGTVVNYGTPGVSGHAPESRALRLNFDQVVDVSWTSEASIAIPAAAEYGLYFVEAVLDDGASDTEGDHTRAENFQCIVVRPPNGYQPGSYPPIAVIVPVNTWMAYNGWPGSDTSTKTAEGLTQRVGQRQVACGAQSIPAAGNNSAYTTMGDGLSVAHFQGWRRPNRSASLYGGSGTPQQFLSVRAPAAARFAQWLDEQSVELEGDGEGQTGFTYHVFTDWDLEDPSSPLCTGFDDAVPVSNYATWITLAHHEYWGPGMMEHLDRHIELGGNVFNFAGNLFLYRADIDAGDGVMETRKWPSRLKVIGVQDGPNPDAQSLIGASEPTGVWRFLYQLEAASPATDRKLDFSMGTIVSSNACGGMPSECFGYWSTTQGVISSHWLWKDQDPSSAAINQFGRTDHDDGTGNTTFAVGHENDALLSDATSLGFVPPRILGEPTELARAPLAGFANAEETPIVSYKDSYVQFTGSSGVVSPYEEYGDDVYQLNQAPVGYWTNYFTVPMKAPGISGQNPDAELRSHGAILHYGTGASGHVVSIPATAAAYVLGVPNLGATDPMETLALRALKCFAFGGGNCGP